MRWKWASAVLALVVLVLAHRALWPPLAVLPSPPGQGERVAFLALGDQGSGDLSQWRVARAMEDVAGRSEGVDFVTLLGDNFYGGPLASVDDAQWDWRFERMYSGRHLAALPFYAVLGNHDYGGDPEIQIQYARQHRGSNRWRMPAHYYMEDFGRAGDRPLLRLVFVDTNLPPAQLAQEVAFIRQAFAPSAVAPVWKVVLGHHPVRSHGRHGDTPQLVATLLPALREAGVDLYLSGHDHNQQLVLQENEPAYVVSGGGGGHTYEFKAPRETLPFAAESLGFVRVGADADRLDIEFFEQDGGSEARFSMARKCAGGASRCLVPEP